ncbi:MAG TPA: hypothetical protein VGR77_02800 [Candidatus Dormibacteraeota bacterium]|nr:hypothetical protein [Candidatus Dormibacteraeota bacterium]
MTITTTARLSAAGAAAIAAALLAVHPVHAAVHHAALVIQHSGGSVLARCVAFAEEQITGLQLIERSDVQYQAQSFGSIGSAMCQIDREPSTVPPGCFGSGAYWQYFHRQGGGWQASPVGASSSLLRDGDMDGWRYAVGANQAPGNVAFAAVCGAPSPPVAASHAASASGAVRLAPTQTTPVPTETPTPATSLEALAPSASPGPNAVLASTGPPTQPPKPAPIGTWLTVGTVAILLLGLGAINLRRRGP